VSDDESPELKALMTAARAALRRSWQVNGNNQLVGTQLETIAVVLDAAGHDTSWIDREWKGSYVAYQSQGGRAKYFELFRGRWLTNGRLR
jgi:hypothetical protein